MKFRENRHEQKKKFLSCPSDYAPVGKILNAWNFSRNCFGTHLENQNSTRIMLCMTNSSKSYSGGRYHAWMLAESLAACGYRLSVWTNNIPVFINDFSDFPGHKLIDIQHSPGFRTLPSGPFEIVMLVPKLEEPQDLQYKSLLLARREHAKFVLMNFETPNWFNKFSPEPREPSRWNKWVEASHVADLILSNSGESNKHAEEFCEKRDNKTLFRYWYPSVNSIVADSIRNVQKARQIICITRFMKGNRHKGGENLINAIGPAMKGYELAIIVGMGDTDSMFRRKLIAKGVQYDVRIRFLYKLSDAEKFREIKKSAVMLFLSYFEGFGYPPVEALYSGVPCIVYDLPVLREVSSDALIYVPPGDVGALQKAISIVLSKDYTPFVPLHDHIKIVIGFEENAKRINNIITELVGSCESPRVGYIPESLVEYWNRQVSLYKLRMPFYWMNRRVISPILRRLWA